MVNQSTSSMRELVKTQPWVVKRAVDGNYQVSDIVDKSLIRHPQVKDSLDLNKLSVQYF